MSASGPEVLQPRPHQTKALADLAAGFAEHDRVQLVMACGTGKTLVGRWLADQQQSALTLVLVPSLALVAQTLTAWRSAPGWRSEALVICSDPSTTAGVAERASADGGDVGEPFWAAHRARVTTQVSAVRDVLARRRPDRPLTLFSTYHSAWVAAQAARDTGSRFDLVVADEAHRLAGAPRAEFRVVLDSSALPASRRLFMTATQVCAPPGPLVSMDDVSRFGPVVHRLDFTEAIERDLLADYEVIVFEAAGDTSPDPVAALLAASSGVHSLLSYHSRVDKARAFAAAVDGIKLPDGRTVLARPVAGTDAVSRRRQTLQLLADRRTDQLVVVSSARCLAEGVDIPAVDGVLFADPKSSDVDVVQAVGRALRKNPGKTHGQVLVPVCIPGGLDDDTVLSTSTFAPVWRILRSLRGLDARLPADLIRAAQQSRRGTPDGSRPTRVQFRLPSIADLSKIVARAVETTSSTWDQTFAALESHTLDHGRARPPRGTALGQWCERQRAAHRRGMLADDRAARLRSLPGWTWDLAEQRWLDQWAQVRSTARRAIRLNVGDSLAMNQRLAAHQRGSAVTSVGRWCAQQRQLNRRGDLDACRRQQLDDIPGWTWTALDPVDEACLDLLADYIAWKGDANPPAGYVDDEQPIGRWLNEIRRRRATDRLAQPLLDELELLSSMAPAGGQLRWYRPETLWLLGLEALHTFVAREGTCRIPDCHVEPLPDTAIPLSTWCRRQRHAHRYGELSDARIALLEGVPGWRWEIQPAPRVHLAVGDTRHGTRTGYVKGCRCVGCTEANRADHSRRAAREAAGLPGTDWVSAASARGHVRILTGQGAQVKTLARAAGLNVKTIEGLLDNTVNRIHPGTEQAVLAVTMTGVRAAAAPGTRVPAGPTWQLLEDILRRGWPKSWIAREIGHGSSLQLARTTITAENARRVEALHRQLGTLRPPARRKGQSTPTLAEIEAKLQRTA